MTNLDASQTPPSDSKLTTSHSPLARLAGPLALSAGLLMVVVEVVIFPIVDRDLGVVGVIAAMVGTMFLGGDGAGVRTPVPAGATEAVS